MKFFLIWLAFLTPFACISQEKAFKISFPKGWIKFTNENTLRTVKENMQLPDSVKQQIINNNKSSVLLYGYTAPSTKGSEYRPNIQVILRKNSANDTTQLLQEVELNMIHFQTLFKEFSIIDRPHVALVGGRHAIELKFAATTMRQKGVKAPFFSRMIIIPDGEVFYQVSMNDSPEYNCDKEFDNVLLSISLVAEK